MAHMGSTNGAISITVIVIVAIIVAVPIMTVVIPIVAMTEIIRPTEKKII